MKPTPEEKEALKASLLASGKTEAPPPGAREQGLARLLEAEAKPSSPPLARAARIAGGVVVVAVAIALFARGPGREVPSSADAGLVLDGGKASGDGALLDAPTTFDAGALGGSTTLDAGALRAESTLDAGETGDAGALASSTSDAGPGARALIAEVSQRPALRPQVNEADADLLARELALLDDARRQLPANPAQALATLDVHARTFPRGGLRTEAALLRVQTLLALGRRPEAEKVARALRATERDGLVSKRLDRLLDAGTP